jgi:hypothetical protein
MKDTSKFRAQLKKVNNSWDKVVIYSQIKSFMTTVYVDYVAYKQEDLQKLVVEDATNNNLTTKYRKGDRLCNYTTIKQMHKNCETDKNTLVLSFSQLMSL